MLGFWSYHSKWGEFFSNVLRIFYPRASDDVSDAQNHLFACWLMSIMPDLTILCMIMLFFPFFTLIQYTSPSVVSMYMLNYSTSKLVKSVEITRAPSTSTLICLHECCSFSSAVRMKRMMHIGDCSDAVGNTHIILVFANTIVSMEMNSQMEVTL